MKGQSLTGRWLIPVLSVVGFLTLWQLVSVLGAIDPFFLPSPITVLKAGIKRWQEGVLLKHILFSLGRIGQGFLIGSILGILSGILMAQVRVIGDMLEPIVDIFRQIPPVAWIPLAILIFGMGEASKIYIITYGATFPILINTFDGARSTDPSLVRAARSLGATPWHLFWRVTLPAAVPHIFTGMWIGLGGAFRGLIAAELAGATVGLGYMIMEARDFLSTKDAIMGMAVIGFLGFFIVQGLGMLRNHFLRWHAGSQD
jgi:ABC-type nitrate/sulfonate/bicarbonate transport system permease component